MYFYYGFRLALQHLVSSPPYSSSKEEKRDGDGELQQDVFWLVTTRGKLILLTSQRVAQDSVQRARTKDVLFWSVTDFGHRVLMPSTSADKYGVGSSRRVKSFHSVSGVSSSVA